MKTMVVGTFALLLGTATIATASTQTIIFGDSLSDAGNEEILLGTDWNSTVYPEGQRTDGTTWADKIGSTFESGLNFAVGGARAVENGDDRADFAAQRRNFFGSDLDLSDVGQVAIWFGGNDFRDLLAAGAPTPAGVAATSTAIITEIVTGIGELSTTGLTDFVVFGLPDLSRLPSVIALSGLPPEQGGFDLATPLRAAVEGHDAALQAALDQLAGATGLNIDFFDVIGLTDQIVANAGDLGFTNLVNSACTEANGVVIDCVDPDGFFFYDSIHPTDAVHELLADAFEDATSTNVVPLPAGFPLLMSGLVLFGLASRRHRSRA